jgi:hypothetical protein
MKKVFLVFVLCLGFSLVSAQNFADVPSDALESQAISRLASAGIINGYNDGTFGGMNKVARAEVAKIFLVAANKSLQTNNFAQTFYDVPVNAWFYSYVHTAAELEIVEGYADGSFAPMAEVNTAEFLKMLVQTFNLDKNITHTYVDVSDSDWFSAYAGMAQQKDIFPLRTTNQLEPARLMTRYEVAYAVDRILYPVAKLAPGIEVVSSYQTITQTKSSAVCQVNSSQVCIKDTTLNQLLTVQPGAFNVVVAEYSLFAPDSDGRFVSVELATNFVSGSYPTFWFEQNGVPLTSKKQATGSQLEFSMDKERFILGKNLSLTLKMDVPSNARMNDFVTVRLLYIDNVWQNQIGDIGQLASFGGKVVIK